MTHDELVKLLVEGFYFERTGVSCLRYGGGDFRIEVKDAKKRLISIKVIDMKGGYQIRVNANYALKDLTGQKLKYLLSNYVEIIDCLTRIRNKDENCEK